MTDLAEEFADLAIEKAAASFGNTAAGLGIGALLGAGGGALKAYLDAPTHEDLRPLLKRRMLEGALVGGGLGGIGGSLWDTGKGRQVGQTLRNQFENVTGANVAPSAGSGALPGSKGPAMKFDPSSIYRSLAATIGGAGAGGGVGATTGRFLGRVLPQSVLFRTGALSRAITPANFFGQKLGDRTPGELLSSYGFSAPKTQDVMQNLGLKDVLKSNFKPFAGAGPRQWMGATGRTIRNFATAPAIRKMELALESAANHGGSVRKYYLDNGVNLARGMPEKQVSQARTAAEAARNALSTLVQEHADAVSQKHSKTDIKTKADAMAKGKGASESADRARDALAASEKTLENSPSRRAAEQLDGTNPTRGGEPEATRITKGLSPEAARQVVKQVVANHPEFETHRENQKGRPQRWGNRMGTIGAGLGALPGGAMIARDVLEAIRNPGYKVTGEGGVVADALKE